MDAIGRRTAEILLDIEAVAFRPKDPFTHSSGRVSPSYIDCRRIISFPKERAEITSMAIERLQADIGGLPFDAVAGGETAGIPFAAWIADATGLAMLYVRKQPKGFGRMAQIEGEMAPGTRVLLVEDLATDGGSKQVFIEAIRAAEGTIERVFVVFHYGIFAASTESLARLGVSLSALATWWDVLAVARERASFSEAELDSVEAY
ncbi:MAG: orotate phosphoribosyltransferase, partial [Alphaproteobacteria bacterium]|nr:orotate phosphoribosyltransferase [Alphaproteobacteria bacterium]